MNRVKFHHKPLMFSLPKDTGSACLFTTTITLHDDKMNSKQFIELDTDLQASTVRLNLRRVGSLQTETLHSRRQVDWSLNVGAFDDQGGVS